jgi:uncharacterized cupredoxin-like copper-binding protein
MTKETFEMFETKAASRGVAAFAMAGALMLTVLPASAGPGAAGHHHQQEQGHHGGQAIGDHGMPGHAGDVDRTVTVIARDTEFDRKKIKVKAGETIRFVIKNKGELVHEFTVGTHAQQKAHQVEMQKMMDAGNLMADKVIGKMGHSHGNSVLVEPGKQGEVIWTFGKAQDLEFGCNVPGHYESGMKGHFRVGGAG